MEAPARCQEKENQSKKKEKVVLGERKEN